MTDRTLDEILTALVNRNPVPGAGLAVLREGRNEVAFAGVTSLENPLPVDASTRFQIGSITKTYTVTAVLRLVHRGAVALDDPVRRYVPELRLADPDVAESITVRDLLNHTAGFDGSQTSGATDRDAPLADFVAGMVELEQIRPLGQRAEYNNAALALAGRLVEKVSGRSFEDAVRDLLLEPLGMSATAFTTDDLMTERCTVGHLADDEGCFRVARPWRWPRGGNPEGGLVSTLADQLVWALFHLGDGDGLLDAAQLAAMRTPTITATGNAMGDAVGLGWWLRDVGGEATAGHQGTTDGQFAELRLVPSRDYAVVVCANGGPAGTQLIAEAIDTVLDEHLGLRNPPPSLRPYDVAHDGDVTGTFANSLSRLTLTARGDAVQLQYELQPAAAAAMPNGAPSFAPCRIDFVEGDNGKYLVSSGPFAGLTGAFARDDDGVVSEIDFGGRWHRRS